uniref:Uncharacterized protein n=1 Tax=Magallana gigas TaxID=29159 RepID=A0A8W8NG50_MAGGI
MHVCFIIVIFCHLISPCISNGGQCDSSSNNDGTCCSDFYKDLKFGTCLPCIGSFGHNCSFPTLMEIGCTIRYIADNKTESKTITDFDKSGRKTIRTALLSGCSLTILAILIGMFLKCHRVLLQRCKGIQESGDCREGNAPYDCIEHSMVSGYPVRTSSRNYTVPPALIKENNAKTDAERKSSKQDIVTNLSLKCKHEYV